MFIIGHIEYGFTMRLKSINQNTQVEKIQVVGITLLMLIGLLEMFTLK